jgi:hypothetical protein
MSKISNSQSRRRNRLAALPLTAAIAVFATSAVQAGSTGRCGGTGGKFTKSITCPAGEYIVGLGERRGMFVDSISAACRKIPVKGSTEPLGPRQSFQTAGASGGTASSSVVCRDNRAIRVVHVYSGGFVDDLRAASCGERSPDGWSTLHGVEGATLSLDRNGTGGHSCHLSCPPGEALYKLTVKYDGWVDSVRGECRR